MNEKEYTVDAFGWPFKVVNWRLIPGNDGIVNPWSDEVAVRANVWSIFDPEAVIIDIGAGFGLYTLPALAHGCIVHSFEPDIRYLDLLTKSVQMNEGFFNRYVVYNFGLWNGTQYPKELSEHMLKIMNTDKIFSSCKLDDIAKNFKRIDTIKIDANGAELGILEGSQEVIKKFRPKFLIEDYNNVINYCTNHNTGQQIINLFKDANYSLYVATYVEPLAQDRYFFIATPN